MSIPKDSQPSGNKVFDSESESGIKFHTYHVGRTVKIYPILESELRSISMLNSLVIMLVSVGTFFLSYAIGLATDWAMQDSITATGTILVNVVVPICLVLCLVFFASAYWAYKRRKNDLDKTLEETGVSQ